MDDTLVKKYEALSKKRESLNSDLIVKETEYKTIRDQYKEDLDKACKKYGVSSLDELKDLLKKEEDRLSRELATTQKLLDAIKEDSVVDI